SCAICVPKGVKAVGVMALGTFSAIAVLLGELDSDLEPGDDNAITVGLDAATFTQSSRPTPATPRPRRPERRSTGRAGNHAASRSASCPPAGRRGPRSIPR